MRRMLWAVLLAAPMVLASAEPARAQGCASGNCGGAGWGRGPSGPGFGVPPFGCPFGFCFRLFPGLHQHGPLVNYGPYEGYYPFEPYGPWTSDLRYNGPTGPAGGGLGVNTGWAPWVQGLRGRFARGGGAAGGGYALTTLRNVGARLNPFHREGGCGDSCGGGHYALATFRNVGARMHPFHRFGCGTGCGN